MEENLRKLVWIQKKEGTAKVFTWSLLFLNFIICEIILQLIRQYYLVISFNVILDIIKDSEVYH